MVVIFIYRRDLRKKDNKGLNAAIEYGRSEKLKVLPIFIFTPEQIKSNEYKSDNALKFMIHSLKELEYVQYFFGDNVKVLENIIAALGVKAIFSNMDYSHYARERDNKVQKLCREYEIKCELIEDYNLHPMGSILSSTNEFYTVFTPFKNKAMLQKVDMPTTMKLQKHNVYQSKVTSKFVTNLKNIENDYIDKGANPILHGGRKEALKLMKEALETQKKYEVTRSNAWKTTTMLSAHIKFGTLSIRECYYGFKAISSGLIGQLYWNEFYDQLMYNLPMNKTIGKSNFKGLKVKWDYEMEKKYLKAWKEGRTGFPFIDAGMRQLNTEGWMHNRARMAVANFLAMILLIDWRKGEKYFATKLTDYDVSQNNGNWQWSCGIGVDKTGYLRVFNPYSQGISHDPDCKYIKKYIPELIDIPIEHIHKWNDTYDIHKNIHYPKPIVEYKERRKIAIKAYK